MSQRIMLNVIVDLDMMPGTFHTPKSARDSVEAILLSNIPHYNPTVLLDQIEEEQPVELGPVSRREWAQEFFGKYLKKSCPHPACRKDIDELCDTDGVWIHVERINAYDL